MGFRRPQTSKATCNGVTHALPSHLPAIAHLSAAIAAADIAPIELLTRSHLLVLPALPSNQHR